MKALVSGLALAALAAPAFAGQRAANERANAKAVLVSHAFARCIVLKRRDDAMAILNAATVEEAKAADNIRMQQLDCPARLKNSIYGLRASVPNDIYRGLLAEELVNSDTNFDMLPSVPRQPAYSRAWFAVTGRPFAVDEMATCASETAPAELRAVLASGPGTVEEKAAMGSIAQILGSCLRAGATLNSNRQSLRAALAEAYYHRLHAPAEPQQTAEVSAK